MVYVAFHLICAWPVHGVRCEAMRASALAGMTAVNGHDKCRGALRRMTGIVLHDTRHVADVYGTWHVARATFMTCVPNGRPRCIMMGRRGEVFGRCVQLGKFPRMRVLGRFGQARSVDI